MISPDVFVPVGAVLSNIVMWASAVYLLGQGPTTPQGIVSHEQVVFTAPVFLSAIVATATFTWILAKYDNARIKRMESLERALRLTLSSLKASPKARQALKDEGLDLFDEK